jgi:hypothetical protein
MKIIRFGLRSFPRPLLAMATIAFILASGSAFAGSFLDSSFDEAETKARDARGEEGTSMRNTRAVEAADRLSTAGTVKTVADYVGMAATAGTIGAEGYAQFGTDDKKVKALNEQYQAALANGNKKRAEEILAELDEIKRLKQTAAKGQADIYTSAANIQRVAGVANLGAAAGSGVAAYMGYNAAGMLSEGACDGNGIDEPTPASGNAPSATPRSSNLMRCQSRNNGDRRSRTAITKSRDAARTAIWYGVGEAVVGAGSLLLASKNDKNAADLQSLVDDPMAGFSSEKEAVFYDQIAERKCGAGSKYELLGSPIELPPANTDSGVRVATGGTASTTIAYNKYYERIACIKVPVPADGGGGGGGTVPTTPGGGGTLARTDIQCTMEALRCWDGSYVARDPQLNCAFRACPLDTRSINATAPVVTTTPGTTSTTMTTSTSGASRSLASATEATNAVSTTGASKAPISNIGVEVERDQNNILRNGY